MSSHPVTVPPGLTRGYSNAFTDMLIRVGCSNTVPVLSTEDLDLLDAQQSETVSE